jgi:hypothetical protein
VFCDRALRILVLLGWLAAFYAIPEGIAVPYAGKLGGGPVAAGLLIAASQLGAAVATPVFTKRIGPLTRMKWMGPMAVCTCAVLLVVVVRPGLVASMAIFAVSNTFAMYQIAANTAFVERVAGAVAEVVPPSTVIAASGGLGVLVACGLAVSWRGMSPAVGRHSARHLGREASLTRRTPVHAARSVGGIGG